MDNWFVYKKLTNHSHKFPSKPWTLSNPETKLEQTISFETAYTQNDRSSAVIIPEQKRIEFLATLKGIWFEQYFIRQYMKDTMTEARQLLSVLCIRKCQENA